VTARLIARCSYEHPLREIPLVSDTSDERVFDRIRHFDGLAVCDFTPRVDEKQISIQKLPDDEVP
jgi:hypothetical protein